MIQPVPDRSPQRRIVPPEDAEERLKDFGMTVAVIRQSIETGDTARRRVMPRVYPRTFAGVTMWAETLAAWRQQMLKRRDDYEIGLSGGYETIYCEKRGVAFAVVAGDSLRVKRVCLHLRELSAIELLLSMCRCRAF